MSDITLLMMDNDAGTLDMWSRLLEENGYQVRKAHTLKEAENIVGQYEIHLAILDARMVNEDEPNDISGLVLAANYAFRDIPKIILTGHRIPYDDQRKVWEPIGGEPPAMVTFVGKGEEPQTLLQEIQKVLSTSEDRDTGVVVPGESTPLKTQQVRLRLAGGITAIITLLLSMGAGIVAIVVGDPRWLLATVFFAILMVVGTGLAIFLPN